MVREHRDDIHKSFAPFIVTSLLDEMSTEDGCTTAKTASKVAAALLELCSATERGGARAIRVLFQTDARKMDTKYKCEPGATIYE